MPQKFNDYFASVNYPDRKILRYDEIARKQFKAKITREACLPAGRRAKEDPMSIKLMKIHFEREPENATVDRCEELQQ
ncbi:hypothetical protein COS81_02375 [candidate division WWE3 bacterium CG06_land_8_20_14_3_00_42_16]|uniref:Uncharacterized protein n=4 Tax=Katanobacteria TaxID=422282 RepID=A0A2M7ANB3_UNCKA|nr:MAG: hypothetical protein AUJ38_01185 [bacterium CG1_02_42_9]PIU68862.1 MAG: hypothetical protein COS81_02375 [candidate division WWE3 bacterium CG06_land_8_20_14_3_00_42_16]PIZ42720.1 MAG: hypothetical protein COY34_02325 [candidate division WWE3 bacterium CG_4_10_14_0_2_um_filter_42_8]PJA37275.1 MAG: hypothetical protein CO181_04245 [candidate division WWE3 bacterium CG_4_9_14_3_um_filter_43_9]PJC68882.1 MAG: hypothetical protein CO015_02455 [candidate division WWE3 bacterium CG_4_8_14_3_u